MTARDAREETGQRAGWRRGLLRMSPRSWISDARGDIRYGLRRWASHPLFAGAATSAIATLATYVPADGASRLDPLTVLRAE